MKPSLTNLFGKFPFFLSMSWHGVHIGRKKKQRQHFFTRSRKPQPNHHASHEPGEEGGEQKGTHSFQQDIEKSWVKKAWYGRMVGPYVLQTMHLIIWWMDNSLLCEETNWMNCWWAERAWMEIQSISENWKIRPTNDSRLSANLEVVARRLFAKGSFPIEKATTLEN